MQRLLDWIRGTAERQAAPVASSANDDAMALTNQAIVKARRASVEHPDGPPEYWQVGDLAQLQSGSPTMTVTRIGFGVIQCTWFHGTKLKKEWFPQDALVDADEN